MRADPAADPLLALNTSIKARMLPSESGLPETTVAASRTPPKVKDARIYPFWFGWRCSMGCGQPIRLGGLFVDTSPSKASITKAHAVCLAGRKGGDHNRDAVTLARFSELLTHTQTAMRLTGDAAADLAEKLGQLAFEDDASDVMTGAQA